LLASLSNVASGEHGEHTPRLQRSAWAVSGLCTDASITDPGKASGVRPRPTSAQYGSSCERLGPGRQLVFNSLRLSGVTREPPRLGDSTTARQPPTGLPVYCAGGRSQPHASIARAWRTWQRPSRPYALCATLSFGQQPLHLHLLGVREAAVLKVRSHAAKAVPACANVAFQRQPAAHTHEQRLRVRSMLRWFNEQASPKQRGCTWIVPDDHLCMLHRLLRCSRKQSTVERLHLPLVD